MRLLPLFLIALTTALVTQTSLAQTCCSGYSALIQESDSSLTTVGTTTPEEAEAVKEYWTPERRAAAQPASMTPPQNTSTPGIQPVTPNPQPSVPPMSSVPGAFPQ